MNCPKCGFEQPDGPECLRCGIVVSRYRGPAFSGGEARPSPPPAPLAAPPPPPPPSPTVSPGTLFGDPAPAVAGGGTVYGGTLPAASGGTVYGGTVFGGPGSAPAAQNRITRRFEIGQVLSETFSVYFSNFIAFALLTGIALAPLYLAQAYIATLDLDAASPSAFLPLMVLFASAVLCPYLATGAITYGVFQQMRGGDASIGDCLGRGLSSLLPVVGLAIVQGIAIFFGLIFCVVPGVLLALRWAVSVPAAVAERLPTGEAMARSTYLTDGHRGDVFGILFVLNFLDSGSTAVLTLFAAKNQELVLLLTGLKSLVTVGLSATASAVMYYRLRSLNESIDVDQISSVFA